MRRRLIQAASQLQNAAKNWNCIRNVRMIDSLIRQKAPAGRWPVGILPVP